MRTPVNAIRAIGRNTQGVTLFSIDEGDKLVSVARVVPEEIKAEEGDEEEVLKGEPDEEKIVEEGIQEEHEE
jgi:DNA gyrase subunit A